MGTIIGGKKVYFNYGTKIVQSTGRHVKTTQCVILKDDKEIASATVSRFHKDVDCKAVARKNAFAKTVIAFPKAERRGLWDEFREKVTMPV